MAQSAINSANHSVELLHHNGARLLDTMSKLYQVTGSQGLQFHLGNHPEFLGLFKTLKSSMENVALLRVASDRSLAPQSH